MRSRVERAAVILVVAASLLAEGLLERVRGAAVLFGLVLLAAVLVKLARMERG